LVAKRSGKQRPIPYPSSCAGRMETGLEFLDELIQLFCVDVANCKEFETPRPPALDVEPLHRFELRPVICRGCLLYNKEIDHMGPAPVDDRSNGSTVDIVEPAANQREALRRQVHDRRCDVDLAIEPWFHRVLVACLHVGEVVSLKRAHMRGEDVAKYA